MAKVNRAKSPTPTPQARPNNPQPRPSASQAAKAIAPTSSIFSRTNDELIFGKQNYFWGLIGVGLIALGLICMLGGAMPNPDMWDDKIIYSFRIVTLAPFLIVAGLAVEIYAIFRKA